MKKIYNLFVLTACLGFVFTACKKFDDLDSYGNGKAVTMTASSQNVAPPASDSDNVVLTLNWTDPQYATDKSNYKFVIEIAEKGKNFANASQSVVVAKYKKEFTGRELNNILGGFGFLYDEPHDMEVRVASSYYNNNERYYSNVMDITMTAYKGPSTSIDATTMNVIGDAAQGWDVDVPMNLIGTKKFAVVTELQWGKEFKIRRDAGNWDINWGIADDETFGFGTPMGIRLNGPNFKLPDGSGSDLFLIIADVDNGTLTINKLNGTMNIIGEAGIDWNTDIPMTHLGNGVFSVVTNLSAKEMKFREVPGSWDVNWGIAAGESLELGTAFSLQQDGPNINIPADGRYKVVVDLGKNSATISASNFPDNLYLVGGGVPAGWDPGNSAPFTKLEDGKFRIYSPISQDGEFKFLQAKSWDGDWGDNKNAPGILEQNDEQNCKITDEGFYRIDCDFIAGTWTTLRQEWGIIGSATSEGWNDDTPMVKSGDYSWKYTGHLSAGEIKFRANHDWGFNFGDNGADGTLEGDGANIAIAEEGNYEVEMILAPEGYTYTVKKL